MPKYLTSKQLGILPEERKGLIAFVKADGDGRVAPLDGRQHYYHQSYADNPGLAEFHNCDTAGCVAGFVYAHARYVQGKRRPRGQTDVDAYASAAANYDPNPGKWWTPGTPISPVLHALYSRSLNVSLARAQHVVDNTLRTGRVEWS